MDLSAQNALRLVGELQVIVSEVREKEETLLKDFRQQRFAVERKLNQGNEAAESWMSQKSAEVEELYEALTKQVEETFEARKKRIANAVQARQRNLPKLGDEARGRWLGAIQGKRMVADSRLKTALREAEASVSDGHAKLAELANVTLDVSEAARRAFSGYGMLVGLLRRQRQAGSVSPAGSQSKEELWQNELSQHLEEAKKGLERFRGYLLPRFFSSMPLVVLIPLILALGLGLAYAALISSDWQVNAAVVGGGLAFVILLWLLGWAQSRAVAKEIAGQPTLAVRVHEHASALLSRQYAELESVAKAKHESTHAELQAQWDRADEVEREFEQRVRERSKIQGPRAVEANERLLRARLNFIQAERASEKARLKSEADQRRGVSSSGHAGDMQQLQAKEGKEWAALVQRWRTEVLPIYDELWAMSQQQITQPKEWGGDFVRQWSVPTVFQSATRFGQLSLDLAALQLPESEGLQFTGGKQLHVPVALTYPHRGSILLETQGGSHAAVTASINNIILRLLCSTPPGKLAFTIIDPVGLGQNFSGLMHLGVYEETVINRRIWTQRDQIEERLEELNEHIEKVIQMYLRNEYATITEYNQEAGSVAEKYHFLVIADFPSSFSETAAKRLASIISTGARCGVFTLIHRDLRQSLPDGLDEVDLRQHSTVIRMEQQGLRMGPEQGVAVLQLDAPPADELAVELVHKIGKASIDSNRVQVPFSQIAPAAADRWTVETTQELRVAIGRTGATKLQYLAIGKGTRQHALFAGKTGSGKSTLFHVIITNLALWCSPDEVEFYLIDFKKGVEFKCYANQKLPHAKVIAIESDREFGLSVLQRVDDELKRRGDIFRKMSVQDIPGYKRNGGSEPMPRVLLLIDEFQEFFTEDDVVSQTASLLFDRIVRQGRAFGIHVLLGSQTLGGSYTIPRTTLGQMVIRVALQCNEADAHLIMDENNPAPRLLTRPGEGIYNDAAGALEGNSPFQVVWLGDDERDEQLEAITALSAQRGKLRSPIVFEGNAPADLTENDELAHALSSRPALAPHAVKVWLGAPNSIKGPTAASFLRQSGSHLLIVGQREESALTMLGMAMVSLAAQHPLGTLKLILLHSAVEGSADAAFLEGICSVIPHGVQLCRAAELGDMMNELKDELKLRQEQDGGSTGQRTFLLLHGMQKFKKLRQEDDFSFGMEDTGAKSGAIFADLITEGAALGMHVIATVDSYNNVGRTLSRKTLSEIEMRVLFQMSANDSASLIDSPRAANLGLHRAIYHNEQEGLSETFRPYAAPDSSWVQQVAAQLRG